MKTRFAPSPTGRIHLGNIRAALLSWLLARPPQGVFLLRIEDTDLVRSEAQHRQALLEDLQWLGLQPTEGEGAGGVLGPYRQSERTEVYEQALARLRQQQQAYRCFCSPTELELERKTQLSVGRAPRYSGKCRRLAAEQVEQQVAAGRPFSWRFAIPEGPHAEFEDLVKGQQRFSYQDIGDFIICRSDGSYAFFFVNAIDDALMQVSHVLRGEDHLSNTPRQLAILRALKLEAPRYGHVSLIVDERGAPLSKRTGSRSIEQLRQQGFLPLAIINYLARLGHSYSSDALLSADELAAGFDLNRLSPSPVRFDLQQLHHWQQLAVAALDNTQLLAWLEPALSSLEVERRLPLALWLKPNVLLPEQAQAWVDNLQAPLPQLDAASAQVIESAGPDFFLAAAALVRDHPSFTGLAQRLSQITEARGKALYQPLRAALSGQEAGPDMATWYELLGPQACYHRLLTAAKGRDE